MTKLLSLHDARPVLRDLRRGGRSIGSVHTLGALHAGHARVIALAAEENDHVVVTVYPNKAQLAPGARDQPLARAQAIAARVEEDPPLELHHVQAAPRQPQRRGAARRPAADHDRVGRSPKHPEGGHSALRGRAWDSSD